MSTQSVGGEKGKLKVFVSYSREDATGFADELVGGLELTGFVGLIDRHSISAAENWKTRLGDLIAQSDTVLFVVTPASVNSAVCAWEVEEAVRVGKRIIPVEWLPVDMTKVPEGLAALNFIFFSKGRSYTAGLKNLIDALNTDVVWIREHTRIQQRADEWRRGGHQNARLLSGSDITEAKAWAARRPLEAPQPTPIQLEFIRASEEAEHERHEAARAQLEERARLLKTSEIALAEKAKASRRVSLALAGLALLLIAGAASSISLTRTANKQISLVLTALANATSDAGDSPILEPDREANYARAVRLSVLAARTDVFRPAITEAEAALARSAQGSTLQKVLASSLSNASTALITSDETRVLILATNGAAQLWSVDAAREVAMVLGDDWEIESAILSQRGDRFFAKGLDGSGLVIDPVSGAQISRIGGNGSFPNFAIFSPDSMKIFIANSGGLASLWNANSGVEESRFRVPEGRVLAIDYSDAQPRLLTVNDKVKIWNFVTQQTVLLLNDTGKQFTFGGFSPDGLKVVLIDSEGAVFIYELSNGSEISRFQVQGSAPVMARFSHDSKKVVTLGQGAAAEVWDVVEGKRIAQLAGHTGLIISAEFSPIGDQVVTGSEDTTARVWDSTSGQELARLEYHSQRLTSAKFTSSGKRILTLDSAGILGLWNAPNFARVAAGDAVRHVSLSRDGKTVATAGDSGNEVRVWSLPSMQPIALTRHGGVINSLDFDSTGKKILTSSDDGVAQLWDPIKNKLIAKYGLKIRSAKAHGATGSFAFAGADGVLRIGMVDATSTRAIYEGRAGAGDVLAFSPEGRHIVFSDGLLTPAIVNVDSGAVIARLTGHQGLVLQASYSADGSRIATAGADGTVGIWDARTGVRIFRGVFPNDAAPSAIKFLGTDNDCIVISTALAGVHLWDASVPSGEAATTFAPQGARLVSLNDSGEHFVFVMNDGSASIWSGKSRSELGRVRLKYVDIRLAALDRLAKKMVAVTGKKDIVIWDIEQNARLGEYSRHYGEVSSITFSPSGNILVSTTADGKIHVWKPETQENIGLFENHEGDVSSISYWEDKGQLWADAKKAITVWDATTRAVVLRIGKTERAITSAEFHPQGDRVLSIGDGGDSIHIWDPHTGNQVAHFKEVNVRFLHATYSRDGEKILSVTNEGAAFVWHAASRKLLVRISAHLGEARFGAFSPDGKRIVTSGADKLAKVWDATSGAQLAEYSGHEKGIRFSEFSPDGLRAISISDDYRAHVWNSVSGIEIARIEGVIKTAFSPDGSRLVGVETNEKGIVIWDANTGGPVFRFAPGGYARPIFSSDGAKIMVGLRRNGAVLLDVEWAMGSEDRRRSGRPSLMSAICDPIGGKLHGNLRKLTTADTLLMPVLRGSAGEDVCSLAATGNFRLVGVMPSWATRSEKVQKVTVRGQDIREDKWQKVFALNGQDAQLPPTRLKPNEFSELGFLLGDKNSIVIVTPATLPKEEGILIYLGARNIVFATSNKLIADINIRRTKPQVLARLLNHNSIGIVEYPKGSGPFPGFITSVGSLRRGAPSGLQH